MLILKEINVIIMHNDILSLSLCILLLLSVASSSSSSIQIILYTKATVTFVQKATQKDPS